MPSLSLPGFASLSLTIKFKSMKKKRPKFQQLEMFRDYKIIIQYRDQYGQVWQEEYTLIKGAQMFQYYKQEAKNLQIQDIKITVI